MRRINARWRARRRRRGGGGDRGVPGGERSAELVVRAVYAEHGRAMRAYASRLLGDPVAAEDIVQEALVRLWRNPQVLHNGKGSVRGWLLTVVRNLVTDRIRARAARPPEVAETTGAGPVQGDHADFVSASVTIRAALEQLSPEHRSALEHLYFRASPSPRPPPNSGCPATPSGPGPTMRCAPCVPR